MVSSRLNLNKALLPFALQDSDDNPWPTVILVVTLVLVAAGLVMVYSASMISAMKRFGDPAFFFKRQALFAALGLVVMLAAANLPLRLIRRLTVPMLLFAFVGLVLCLTPLGTTVKGASRWISLGSFNLQPSEMAKLAIIFYVAQSMGRKVEKIKSFTIGFLPHLMVAGVFAFLCVKEPDLGAAVMIMLLCFVMLFIGGTRLGYLLGSVLAFIPALYVAIVTSPYRMKRLISFMYPQKDALGLNYQINESLISIGSGGILGKGIGEGKQKLFFLPDSHTDFIASIIGEELGFVGMALIVLAFGALLYAGLKIALRCKNLYGLYLASGITLFLGFQVVINLGVVLGLLPTKGMTLPFLSYGGSSLLSNLFAVGVLLAVGRQAEMEDESGLEPGQGGGEKNAPIGAAER
jgi:cell division protein FtsW